MTAAAANRPAASAPYRVLELGSLVATNQRGERAERGLDESLSALVQMRLRP